MTHRMVLHVSSLVIHLELIDPVGVDVSAENPYVIIG